MSKHAPKYVTFILRCWEERIDERGHHIEWRFTLKDPVSGKRMGFPTVDALCAFLVSETDSANT